MTEMTPLLAKVILDGRPTSLWTINSISLFRCSMMMDDQAPSESLSLNSISCCVYFPRDGCYFQIPLFAKSSAGFILFLLRLGWILKPFGVLLFVFPRFPSHLTTPCSPLFSSQFPICPPLSLSFVSPPLPLFFLSLLPCSFFVFPL